MKPERTNQLPSSDERKEGGIIGSNWNNIYSGEDEPRSKGSFSTSEKIRSNPRGIYCTLTDTGSIGL